MKIDLGYCNGKKKYRKRDAETMKNYRMKEGSDPLRIYQCDYCNLFHLTHTKGREKIKFKSKREYGF